MKKTIRPYLALALAGLAMAALASASAGDDAVQATRTAASAFELKMRILEGSREKPNALVRPVTSSYLEFLTFANFEAEEDVAVEQQIKKVYNLKDVGLLTEARLVWEKGKTEKAFHCSASTARNTWSWSRRAACPSATTSISRSPSRAPRRRPICWIRNSPCPRRARPYSASRPRNSSPTSSP